MAFILEKGKPPTGKGIFFRYFHGDQTCSWCRTKFAVMIDDLEFRRSNHDMVYEWIRVGCPVCGETVIDLAQGRDIGMREFRVLKDWAKEMRPDIFRPWWKIW